MVKMIRSPTLSVDLNTESSVTYLDDFESCTQSEQCENKSQSPLQRMSALFSANEEAETSNSKVDMLPKSENPGKENSVRNISHGLQEYQSKSSQSDNLRRRKSRILKTIQSENSAQSLPRGMRKSTGVSLLQKETKGKRKTKRMTTAFEVLLSDDRTKEDDNVMRNSNQRLNDLQPRTPVSENHNCQLKKKHSLTSPEYSRQGEFYDAESCESSNESLEKIGSTSAGRDYVDGEQVDQLVRMFPNVDPTFLASESERLKAPLSGVIDTILPEIEKGHVPIKHNKKRPEKDFQENYANNFSDEEILKLIPDPWAYFSDKGRNCRSYSDHSLYYLKTKFRKYYTQTLSDALLFHGHNLYLAYKYLMKKNRGIKMRMTNRPLSECNASKPNDINLQFLLEVAFIEREEMIRNHVKNHKTVKKYKEKEAARLGLLVKCQSCYKEGFLQEDTVQCCVGHIFCKVCVTKSIESEIEHGDCEIGCLAVCSEKYPIKLIQELIKPEYFSKLVLMYEALNYPKIEDLAHCPFCCFVTILPQEVKVVSCFNIRCLKRSCRICKELNHQPVECNETKIVEIQAPTSGIARNGLIRSTVEELLERLEGRNQEGNP